MPAARPPATEYERLQQQLRHLQADMARMQRAVDTAHAALSSAMIVEYARPDAAQEIVRRIGPAQRALAAVHRGNTVSPRLADAMIERAAAEIATVPVVEPEPERAPCCAECGGDTRPDSVHVGGRGYVSVRRCCECSAIRPVEVSHAA